MTCSEIARLAPLYITGEIDARSAAEFDAHLKSCPSCMQELERQARLDARLREVILAEETNVARVDRRIRELIAAETAGETLPELQSRSRGWVVSAISVAAAALILIALGYHTLLGTRVARVYADAARDHHLEVVQRQPRPWLTDPAQIAALAEKQGIAPSAVTSLASGSYHLNRGRLCFLDGRIFLHLVFSDGAQEFSVYLRERDAKALPGPAREIANGKPLCTSDVDSEHIASIETSELTAVVVTDRSSDAALNFARFASAVL